VGILFTVYFCILYQKTVFFVGFTFLQNHDFSPEHLKFLFSTVNLIPFRTIIDQIGQWPAAGAAGYQLSGNLLMLAPLGFSLLYFKWAKNWKQALLYAFLCTFAIEFIQFLHNLYFRLFSMGMNRSTDIDDILLNTAGALLGIGIYTLWSGITGRRTRAHQPKQSVSSK
jgi:glycopeptide antibiotics resistance protein